MRGKRFAMCRLAVLAVTALLMASGASADEVTDQIDAAKRYYGEGDLTGAIEELEFARQALQAKQGAAYLATLPPAPAGWSVQDTPASEQAAVVPFAGTALQRVYTENGGAGRIEAQLLTGGGFMQGLAAMLTNPQILAAQPGAKRVRVGRENAVLTFDEGEKSGQLVMDLGGKLTLMLDGSALRSGDTLVSLANAWDVRRALELAGL